MQPRLIPRVAIRLATRLVTVAAGLAASAGPLHAHTGAPPAPHDLWSAWTRDPVILLPLLLSAVIYAVGSRRLRRHAGRGRPGRGLSGLEAAAFWTGWTTLAVALASPLHALGSALFSAHMAQHELMVTLAAPLLVLGRPAIVAVWALPRSWRGHVRVVTAPAVARRAWRTLTAAGLATLLHAVALWGWHLPALYRATLRSELAHGLQHTSFLGTALLFWGALLAPRARRAQAGAGVAWLFLTGLHTVALGTLLAISTRLWVPEYAATTAPWGLMPLEDQQLAGLLMWVPGSTSYLGAALWLFSSWLSASDARVRRRRALAGALPVVVIAVLAAGCHPDDSRVSAADAAAMTGGDAARGRRLIRTYGCGECHTVPGVPGADALVGPELTHTGRRVYIAGSLPNSPANLVRFIQHPRQVDSLTAMPELGVRDQEARDMAAYIYTLH